MSADHGWLEISRCATSDAVGVAVAFLLVFIEMLYTLKTINLDPSYTCMRLFLPTVQYFFPSGGSR